VENNFIVVKVKKDLSDIVNRFEESFLHKAKKYYNVTTTIDKETLEALCPDVNYIVLFIIFNVSSINGKPKYEAEKLFIGEAEIKSNQSIYYLITGQTNSNLVISNFISTSGLDLKTDFASQSYITIECSQELLRQIDFATHDLYQVVPNAFQVYRQLDSESSLSKFSQRNEMCTRALAMHPVDEHRSEFQRDRERIVHAKAFRRLVDKAQIFTSSKGDHYRTRMTHTLEVSQIARGIARELNVNVDLTEAIALAHDIGHTPFGHQGERTLDAILKNRINIIPDADKINFGGFKHNFHGLRVLSFLEEKYLEHDGLDLSYQVLEGVLKHTSFKALNCTNCVANKMTCGKNCCEISDFLVNGRQDLLYSQDNFAHTLEGQIVNIADEIAQRGHDLDDAFAAHHLSMGELLSEVSIKKMDNIRRIITDLETDIYNMEEQRRLFDREDMIRSRLVPVILAFFIRDVVEQSNINIDSYKGDQLSDIDQKLVDFSSDGKFMINSLEKTISKKVLNSSEVARFDDKGRRIVTELFQAYYYNPKLLPDSTLRRIYREIRTICPDVIDFRSSDSKLVTKELQMICFGDSNDETNIAKRKILVRSITDYIAGMTDNFAINEYNTLVLSI
jgi:dGTPase